MKRLLSCILYFMLFSVTDVLSIQKNKNLNYEFSDYSFCIKEFLSFTLTSDFLVNQQKMKEVLMFCCKGDHKNDTQLLWLLLIFSLDEDSLDELKNHIYNDLPQEFSLFVLRKYRELRIPCDTCKKYSDYYVLKQ